MALTKWQIKLLSFYQRHRTETPTIFAIIRRFLPSWTLITLMTFVASVLSVAQGWSHVSWLLVGLWFGVFCRDVGSIRGFFRSWPVWQRIIDWDRVDQLLDQTETPPKKGQ